MKRSHRNTRICALLLGMLSFSAGFPAMAANLLVTPGFSLDERWDSNIHNASANEISDYVTRVSPRLKFTLETLSADLSVTGGFDYERYAKHAELNEGATMFYGLESARPLRITPRFSLHPSARFVETNDPVQRNVLTESPIPGLPPSETVVTGRAKSREVAGSLHLGYLVTPNVDFSIGGGGTKRTYLDNLSAGVDSDTVSGNALIRYHFTPRFSAGIHGGADRNTFGDNTESRTYDLGLSVNYRLTEDFSVSASAGANHAKETRATVEKTATSPSGQLSLLYKSRDFKTVLRGSYGLAGGGSFGVTTRRGAIYLSLGDQFAKGWWWNLSGSYQINRSLDTPRTEDISTWHGDASLRYQAAKWASIRLAGSLERQRARNSVEGADLDRNSVVLGFDLHTAYKLL